MIDRQAWNLRENHTKTASEQAADEDLEPISHPAELEVASDPLNTLMKPLSSVTSPQSDKKISKPSFLPSINAEPSMNVTGDGNNMRELDALIRESQE